MKKYSWDLDYLLEKQSYQMIEECLLVAQQCISQLHKQGIFNNEDNFRKYHNESLKLSILNNRIGNYLSNKTNEELSNPEWFNKSQELDHKTLEFQKTFSNFENEIIDNKANIKQFLQKQEFSYLHRYYDRVFALEGHTLDKQISLFMAPFSPLDSSYYSLFTLLEKELNPKDAIDENRNKYPIINYSKYIELQKHSSRKVRKSAYLHWREVVHQKRDSLSRLLYYNCVERDVGAKSINFEGGYFEGVCFGDEIPQKLIPFIYEKIQKNQPLVRKYHRIHKQALRKFHGLKTIHPWDLRLELKKDNSDYSIEQAMEMAIESLAILGPVYRKYLDLAFNENWIDWLPKKDKISGAYCISGTYGLSKKFILLNYSNKLDDISTLVHELGHAIHAKFFEECGVYAGVSIFIAEIPSILNELIFIHHLLSKNIDDAKKIELYDQLISSFIGTTTNQIVFSEFEYQISDLIRQGQAFNATKCELIYEELRKKYISNKKIKDKHRTSLTSILTVPHFYSNNFYVYKYCVGQVVALKLFQRIKDNPDYLDTYFKFLSIGKSQSNLDSLKVLGIDLFDNDLWKSAQNTLSHWIDEYQNLIKKK